MKLELGLEKSAAHSVYFFKAARKENQAARLTMGTQVRGKGQKTSIIKPASEDFYAKRKAGGTFSPLDGSFFRVFCYLCPRIP